MKIGIHQNKDKYIHTGKWSLVWIKYCKENNLDFEIVNCYSTNIIEEIERFDILLWHFGQYSLQDMQFARSILKTIEEMGIITFPNSKTAWHFDDKIAETYLLQSMNAPIPKSWFFYSKKSALDYFDKECSYPIVAKLKCGSGSSNVKLLRNKKQAYKYSNKMFKNGYKAAPKIIFKAKSNIKSSKNLDTFIKRFIRIPDFIHSYSNARKLPNEKGYVYLQEYIPNDGFDLKVVVVGEKLSFCSRNVRSGDFRASGGGSVTYDKELITKDIRKIAFDLSRKLKFQSMGYDFVINNLTKEAYIIEISYGYSHVAQMDLGGYWNTRNEWFSEEFNAPIEILRNLMKNKEKV